MQPTQHSRLAPPAHLHLPLHRIHGQPPLQQPHMHRLPERDGRLQRPTHALHGRGAGGRASGCACVDAAGWATS